MSKKDANSILWDMPRKLKALDGMRERRDALEEQIRTAELEIDADLEALKPAFPPHSITHVTVGCPATDLMMLHREQIGPGRDVLTVDLVRLVAWCDVRLPEVVELEPVIDDDAIEVLDRELAAAHPLPVPDDDAPCDGSCGLCLSGHPCPDRQPQVVS